MERNEYNETYQGHTIQFFVSKVDDNDFWNASGFVASPDALGYKNFWGTSQKFTAEEDAKEDFLRTAKAWVDSQVRVNRP